MYFPLLNLKQKNIGRFIEHFHFIDFIFHGNIQFLLGLYYIHDMLACLIYRFVRALVFKRLGGTHFDQRCQVLKNHQKLVQANIRPRKCIVPDYYLAATICVRKGTINLAMPSSYLQLLCKHILVFSVKKTKDLKSLNFDDVTICLPNTFITFCKSKRFDNGKQRAEKVSDKLCKEYAEWKNFLFFSYIVERWYLASLRSSFIHFLISLVQDFVKKLLHLSRKVRIGKACCSLEKSNRWMQGPAAF